MSAKKQKTVVTGWHNCSKCNKRIARQLITKHTSDEDSCRPVYPFVKDNELYCQLNNVTTATRKIGDLPFIKDKRVASSTLFLSEELIKECGFTTFGWVSVNPLTAQCTTKGPEANDGNLSVTITVERDDSEVDIPDSNYSFRIWPIPESIGSNQCSLLSVLSMEGFSLNKFAPSNPKLDGCGDSPSGLVSVKPLASCVKPSFEIFCGAEEITLVISNFHEIDELSFDMNRFIKTFKKLFQSRPVSLYNRFKIRFYTQFIHFHVSKIVGIGDKKSPDEETLGLERLSIRNCDNNFYQIVASTVINVTTLDKVNLESISGVPEYKISLQDVGGLSNVTNEICSTVKFILSTSLDGKLNGNGKIKVPKGILIYGHTGVGKSLIVQAISNEFNLFQVHYEEFSRSNFGTKRSELRSSSLEKVFKHAVNRAPSVVIVEALDVIAPKKKSDSGAPSVSQFTADFSRLISSKQVKNSKVLLICTTSDLDRVDQSMRSPKIFAKEIEIPIPSISEREEILSKILRSVGHKLSNEDVQQIASSTHGFVAADLRSLCNQASLDAINNPTDSAGASSAEVTMRNMLNCLKSVKPSAIKSILIDVPNVKWNDIGGQDELKFKLKQAIEWPLKHPESFKRLGITSPKGILMYGPPGCSKTMIAKAIANESGLNFISVKGSELFSKWVGESEKAVQAIFRKARQVAPCVIFFDEIDSLGGERGSSSGSSNVHERVLAQILVEIDGIEALKDVTIVAATNRPDRIDQALLRPGRLDRIIYVPLPDEITRKEILRIRFKKMPVDSQVNIGELAQLTEGYSGAELTAVCHEAALKALEEDITCSLIKQNHFNDAMSLVRPRITDEQIKFYQSYSISRKQI